MGFRAGRLTYLRAGIGFLRVPWVAPRDQRHLHELTTNRKAAGSSPAERAPLFLGNGRAHFFLQHRRLDNRAERRTIPHRYQHGVRYPLYELYVDLDAILFLVSRVNGLTSVFHASLPCATPYAGVVNSQGAAPVRRRRAAHRSERRSPTPLGRPRRRSLRPPDNAWDTRTWRCQ
jgi:hypothetical protein